MMHIIILLMVILFSFSSGKAGEIYKWVDKNGKTHYSDKAPAEQELQPLKLQPLNIADTPSAINRDEPDHPDKTENDIHEKPKKWKKPTVTMYGASWCGYCKKAREYFARNRIKYREYDIEKSEKGRREYKKMNGKAVPIILVGKQKLQGFNPQKFEKAYFHPK